MPPRPNPSSALFPLLLAGLLAGMSYWLEMASRPAGGSTDGKSRHDPDYIIEKFEVRRFDPQGILQHTVVADLMRHYPDDDSTVVLAPRVTYHRTPPTVITAREARVSSKGEQVQLVDDVSVVRSGVAGRPDTRLTTARLDVWPDEEIASTTLPVVIRQGQTQVHGSGLHVDNKTSIYVLEGPVNGVFFRRDGLAEAPAAAVPQPVARTATAPKSAEKAKPAQKTRPTPKTRSKSKSKSKSRR